MRLNYFAALPLLSILGGAAQAGSDGATSITYSSIDTSLSAGGATIKGDGNAFSTDLTYISPENSIGTMLAYTTQSGTIGTATYLMSTFTIGVGYEVIDTSSGAGTLGTSVVLGVGYSSTTGEATVSGTEYDLKNDGTLVYAQVAGDLTDSMRLFGSFTSDTGGDTDPTFGVGMAFDISGNNAVSIGYSSNKSTTNGVTAEITGWSLGWASTF